MKVTVRETEDQTFEPFDLVIRVESKAELAALWLSHNLPFEDVVSANARYGNKEMIEIVKEADDPFDELWATLDRKWKERCK